MIFSRMHREQCIGLNSKEGFFIDRASLVTKSLTGDNLDKISLPYSLLERVKVMMPVFIKRIFRLGIISGVADSKNLVFWDRDFLYYLDLQVRGKIKRVKFINFSPLNMCIDSEAGKAVFGDYKSSGSETVSIWEFHFSTGNLASMCVFPSHSIEHVHNIIKIEDDKYLVFAGDFSYGVGIWRLQLVDGAYILTPLSIGRQNYRASAVAVLGRTLVYATDTTTDRNYLLRYSLNAEVVKPLYSLPASSIYGAFNSNSFVFSTNLECDLDSKNTVFKWVTKRLPAVFDTNRVHIYKFTIADGLESVENFRPTPLPYRLFQYPTFRIFVNDSTVMCTANSIYGMHNRTFQYALG